MKRLVVILLVAFGMPIISFSQVSNDTVSAELARLDSILSEKGMDSIWSVLCLKIDSLHQLAIQRKLEYAQKMQEPTMFLPRFKIYSTDNIRILLKLDTKRGKVWMVQYGLGSTPSAEIPIEYSYLVDDEEGWNGRFELYPTKNMFNFIMVDNYDGTTYQVQWDTDPNHRIIRSINSY